MGHSLGINISCILKKIKYQSKDEHVYGCTLLKCILGVPLLGLNIGSFRFLDYWFIISLPWLYLDESIVTESL